MAQEWLNITTDVELLVLLGTANTMPIVAYHISGDRFSTPIDLGVRFLDGRPLLGSHKTWRGVFSSVLGTWIASLFFHVDQTNAVLLALWSMLGDMIASFIKRRLGLESGAKCTGIDQVIESFLPLVVLYTSLCITLIDCVFITFLFVLFEVFFSPFLYKIGFRKNPY